MFIRCAVLFPLLLAGSAHAQMGCTQIGCVDGITISISPDYQWKPGIYAFNFTIDGKSIKCKGTLPLASCEGHNLTCDGEGVLITESGCALPPDAHGFGDIMLESSGSSLALNISRDGQSIAHGNWRVQYNTSQPNGAGCGPICRQATVTLDIK